MAKVHVVSLGGTISSTPSVTHAGNTPSLGAAELLAGLKLPAGIDVTAHSLYLKASPSLQTKDLETLLTYISQVAGGASAAATDVDGIVITQGTDTIEETAFWLEIMAAARTLPVVVTGAMRDAVAPSADGAANIYNAILIAGAPASRHRGVLVSFDDEIHSARMVQKVSTFQTGAFNSAPAGPVGVVAEDSLRYFGPARVGASTSASTSAGEWEEAPNLSHPSSDHGSVRDGGAGGNSVRAVRIAMMMAHPDEDFALATQLTAAGYQGLVIAGMGAGHVSEIAMANLAAVAPQIPIIVSTRVAFGPAFSNTYGYSGGEINLREIGCVVSGGLSAAKSRVLLAALLAAGADRAHIAEAFGYYG